MYRWAREAGMAGRWREVEGWAPKPARLPARLSAQQERRRELAAKAVQMSRDGASKEEIAKQVGMKPDTVMRWLREHEEATGERVIVRSRRRGGSWIVERGQERAVQMRREGKRAAEIAEMLGVDRSQVHRWIRKYNAQEGVEPIARWGKRGGKGVSEEEKT